MRAILAALLFSLCSASALALPYSGIYFFGDSLTDVGNVHTVYGALTGGHGTPAEIPGSPYDTAGRASNGHIYADVLAAGHGYSATPSAAGGNNYAFGGARTRYQTMGSSFMGVLAQVSSFTSLPGNADSSALYVLWAGSNNLQDIITHKTVDALGNPVPGLAGTVDDIALAIGQLYADGVRTILVPNAPDLSLTPRVSAYGPAAIAGAHNLSLAFNTLLALTLNSLEQSLNGLDIIAFDTYGALNDIVANPLSYGLTNTTGRCYTGDDLGFTGGGSVCATPESYLFWDGIHPTSAVHGILGREMLAAVPEPASLGLLALAILGMAVVRARVGDQRG